MIKKTRMNFSVDDDIPFRLKDLEIGNISEVVNSFLRSLFENDNDEFKLKKKLKKLNIKSLEIEKQKAIINFKLKSNGQAISEEQEKKEEEELEEAEQMVEGIKRAGLL